MRQLQVFNVEFKATEKFEWSVPAENTEHAIALVRSFAAHNGWPFELVSVIPAGDESVCVFSDAEYAHGSALDAEDDRRVAANKIIHDKITRMIVPQDLPPTTPDGEPVVELSEVLVEIEAAEKDSPKTGPHIHKPITIDPQSDEDDDEMDMACGEGSPPL